jgi:hypothetical protein
LEQCIVTNKRNSKFEGIPIASNGETPHLVTYRATITFDRYIGSREWQFGNCIKNPSADFLGLAKYTSTAPQ